jgi:ferredoxin/flavodoxin---NADP+ reductase
MRYLASPVDLLGDDGGHVRAVKIENNEIYECNWSPAVRGTGEFDEIPAHLVFRSIGYAGEPVAGISSDEDRGLIRNAGGRVVGEDGVHPTT